MNVRMVPAVALAGLMAGLAAGACASAQPSRGCTHEQLKVQGVSLTASYCVAQVGPPAGHELPVRVQETYSTPRGSVSQETTLRFINGEPSSRVIEDLALTRVGLSGTLHLTLLLQAGLVRVDGAILTPGAVTVK